MAVSARYFLLIRVSKESFFNRFEFHVSHSVDSLLL